MRIFDLIALIFENLGRRKARVALAGGQVRETLSWAAFSYLRPHRFVMLRRHLDEPAPPRICNGDLMPA